MTTEGDVLGWEPRGEGCGAGSWYERVRGSGGRGSKERSVKSGDSQTQRRDTRAAWTGRRAAVRLAGWAGMAGASGLLGVLGGCEADSFMDPSVIGRWEMTPGKVPILNRLAAIEDPQTEYVEYSSPAPEDLYTDPRDYRVGPGDELELELFDLVRTGESASYKRTIDSQGYLELPQLGRLYVAGRSLEQVQNLVIEAMRRFVNDPLAAVTLSAQRQQTYTIVGSVDRPGPYFIPSPDYKLIEALTSGGRFADTVEEVYVIRQVPLDERAMNPRESQRRGATDSAPGMNGGTPSGVGTPAGETPAPNGEALIDLIDRLSPPESTPPTPPMTPPAPTPSKPADSATPVPPPPSPAPSDGARQGDPPIDLPKMGMVRGTERRAAVRRAQPVESGQPDQRMPAVELIDPAKRPATPAPSTSTPLSSWVFLNGEWVQVRPGSERTGDGTGLPSGPAEAQSQVVTQRVIRVPLAPLLAGDSSLNIVVRPGDIIRVPNPPTGQFYLTGQVNRPGVFELPTTGKMTLWRALASGGGLASIAIPERVDLTRVVGDAQQATVRLDLRAIAEGTQPDIYIKTDDVINVGTNFWALPLAVIRNGFRASYGFGVIVDRNFGSDVFGIPPDSNANR